MEFNFTPHVEEKLKRLTKVGITKERIIQTIMEPKKVSKGYYDRKIAQSSLTENLILRVVYEKSDDKITIITAYPAERRRYESNI